MRRMDYGSSAATRKLPEGITRPPFDPQSPAELSLLLRLLFDPTKARPLNFGKVRQPEFARLRRAASFAKWGVPRTKAKVAVQAQPDSARK